MKSVKFLLDLQKTKGMNDTELGKFLGITQGAVSHYKAGRRIMDDETCIAVAMALEIHPMNVIGAACIDRAEKTGQKSLWEVFSQRMATAASILMAVVVTLFLTATPSEAAPRLGSSGASICIMSNRKRFKTLLATVFAWLKGWLRPAALQPTAR